MVRHIRKTNGSVTLDDLANYAVVSRPVKSVTYRGLDLFTVGSPASGAVCLNILKTMGHFDLSDGADANITAHRFAEAMRFCYGTRVELGDPDFVDAAHRIQGHISDDRTQPVAAYDPRRVYAPDSHGTSHITSADASGMAVSLTTTVNLIFGAQIMEPASGIILCVPAPLPPSPGLLLTGPRRNNEMNDFSIPGVPNEFGFEPSEANFVRPGKRPLSSITPVVAARPDGTLYAVIGAAGGSRIISATAGALWHVAEHSMAMPDAVREPRLHDQLMPNTVLVKYDFDNATAAALIQRENNVTWVGDGLSAVQAIRRLDDGSFEAAREPRQKNSGGLTI